MNRLHSPPRAVGYWVLWKDLKNDDHQDRACGIRRHICQRGISRREIGLAQLYGQAEPHAEKGGDLGAGGGADVLEP